VRVTGFLPLRELKYRALSMGKAKRPEGKEAVWAAGFLPLPGWDWL